MKKYFIPLCFAATPASAWVAYNNGAVCLLEHEISGANVTVSHDPRLDEPYAIALEHSTSTTWQLAPVFAIEFQGGAELSISTGRHTISNDGATLSVTDRGFGNVLRGLEFNQFAVASNGEQILVIPLEGAAPEVERFRNCVAAPIT